MSSAHIDSLPYFDKQADDPAARAAAQALIDAELRETSQIAENDPRLPPLVDVFSSSTQLAELLQGYPAKTIQGIDPAKYQPPTVGDDASLAELEAAEKRGRLGEGHMQLRLENSSILSSYGPNAWLVRNYQLHSQLTELQRTAAGLKEQVVEVNRHRRVFQEETGQHLTRLEGRWQDLVGSTVQLALACTAMEGEVGALGAREQQLEKHVAALAE